MNRSVASPNDNVTYRGLTERLIIDGLMSSDEASEISEIARNQGKTLIQELLDGEHLDSRVVAQIASEEYGVPLFDIGDMVQELLPTELVPQSLIR